MTVALASSWSCIGCRKAASAGMMLCAAMATMEMRMVAVVLVMDVRRGGGGGIVRAVH